MKAELTKGPEGKKSKQDCSSLLTLCGKTTKSQQMVAVAATQFQECPQSPRDICAVMLRVDHINRRGFDCITALRFRFT